MAKKDSNDTRPAAVIRSERATNSVLRSLEVLQRRGRGLSAKGKTAVMKVIKEAVDQTEKVLGGQAKAKEGFVLDAADAAETKAADTTTPPKK